MPPDIATIREQFPALGLSDNGRRRVYLDNPAGTQVPQTVIDAVSGCLRDANANLGGPFGSSVAAGEIYEAGHAAMADLLNADSPNEIVFGPNMTTLTFQLSRCLGRQLQAGDEIIVTELDHDANVAPWMLLAQDHGLVIKKTRLDTASGRLDYAHFDSLVGNRTKLVCVGHASNLLGTINDINHVCSKAHQFGALVFVDAVHSAPHLPVDVQQLGCDFLACSPYKFFGPHQGVLWGREQLLKDIFSYKLRPAPDTVPGRFETGTQSHEAIAGVTAAIDYLAGLAADAGNRRRRLAAAMQGIHEYETALCGQLLERLEAVDGICIYGITAAGQLHERTPTVSFTLDGIRPAAIASHLGRNNIFSWSGHSYAVEPCQALGLLESGGVLRVGLVHYNAADDIDALVDALGQLVAEQRSKRSA